MEHVKQVYQVEKLELDTSIGWWNENRKYLNVVINHFNDYMMGISKFNGNTIIGMILDAQNYGSLNSFASWQFDLLSEMLSVL